ncbi:MAG TPA: hypothetical protein PKX31_00390 [Chitinophagaceae bacterium]|nr:hypothetical protein [Chitinophagaceae bacterium]
MGKAFACSFINLGAGEKTYIEDLMEEKYNEKIKIVDYHQPDVRFTYYVDRTFTNALISTALKYDPKITVGNLFCIKSTYERKFTTFSNEINPKTLVDMFISKDEATKKLAEDLLGKMNFEDNIFTVHNRERTILAGLVFLLATKYEQFLLLKILNQDSVYKGFKYIMKNISTCGDIQKLVEKNT